LELILWRHAEAEDSAPDLARPLTPKGRRQAQAMAQWLKSQFTGPVRILSSPAVRTRQTADALGMPYAISEHIAPDASADAMLAASGWPDGHDLVILVGHNPAISELASRLAGPGAPPVAMRRAQACWVVCDAGPDGAPRASVKAMMTPSLLGSD
jgi:phosphohistidine phosphatase